MDGRPYFLPEDTSDKQYSKNQCGNAFCYNPPNPYAQGLCVFAQNPIPCEVINGENNDKYRGIIIINDKANIPESTEFKKHSNYSSSCDFIKFEAIGGGAAGELFIDNASSGASGSYTSTNIKQVRLKSTMLFILKSGRVEITIMNQAKKLKYFYLS